MKRLWSKKRLIAWPFSVVITVGLSGGLVLAGQRRIETQRLALGQVAAKGPRVLVMQVSPPVEKRHLSFPASVHGYVEAQIFAKTPGYLKSIFVDKGDRVHKGEVMAILESPELDKQIADAKANYWLQKVTDVRNQTLVKEEVIPQQTADDSHAALLQAKAAYEQLLALQSYETITAETDGIITARYVDPGALIPQVTGPGSSTPIVELATLHPLRVYADVTQDTATFIKDGDAASLTLTQYLGKTFHGTVTRHSKALDQNTRTMRVEVDLPNKHSLLYPEMYATMKINVMSSDPAPRIPDDALVFRDGKTYAPIVRNNHIHLAPVTLGTDNGREVEIASGISSGDLVAMNVGDSVEEADPVQPVLISAATPID